MAGSANPWDRHLPSFKDRVFSAHGLDFAVTDDPRRAFGPPGDGQALFYVGEVAAMKQAARGAKLPAELSVILHRVKRIMGGEILKCTVDSDPNDV